MTTDFATDATERETIGGTERLHASEAIVRRFLTEVVPSDDVLKYAEVLATDHVQIGPAPYQVFTGIDGSLNYFAGLLSAFPDLAVRVTGHLGMGDQVVAFGTMHGRHTGDLVLGDLVSEPTGREATWKYTVVCRVVDGRIAETRIGLSRAGLMRQLGVPATGGRPTRQSA